MNKRIAKKQAKKLNQSIPLGYGIIKSNEDHAFNIGELVKIIAIDKDGFIKAERVSNYDDMRQIVETYQIDMNIEGLSFPTDVFSL